MTPTAIQLAFAVQQEIQSRLEDADRLRRRQVERAQYEADRARYRYMQIDPANRLVADSLEAEWNARLSALSQAQQNYERERETDRRILDEQDRKRILALASDLPAIWSNPKTPHRERKRMLALVIEDVTLIKQREITAAVRFRGGATTTLTVPRPLTAQQIHATHEDVRQQIDELLDEYTDARVALVLNDRGLRTGTGEPFTATRVQWIRFSAKLPCLKERLLEAGMLTTKQLGQKLGVKRSTIGRWRTQGLIEARICNDAGEWLYSLPKQIPPHRKSPRKSTEGNPTARGAL